MERILNQEDRIRRAEEIYYRRNNLNYRKKEALNDTPKKEYKLFRKIAIQLLICIGIFFIIHFIGANTDDFSTDVVGSIKKTLCYDADVEVYINMAKNYISIGIQKLKFNEKEEAVLSQGEALVVEDTNQTMQETTEQGISQETEQEITQDINQDTSSISQMEQDAQYIKANFSFIKPVTGTITSRFGIRNPTTATVPKYHTGIDIAANEGTVFVAAMEGIVEKVSSQGDYRKPCKNYKWRCCNFICSL